MGRFIPEISIVPHGEEEIYLKLMGYENLNRFLFFMNQTANNSLICRLQYLGTDAFEVEINQITLSFGQRRVVNDVILPHDPIIQKQYLPSNFNAENGSITSGDLESFRYIDSNFAEFQADKNNLSIEFIFEILPGVDRNLWYQDYWDWLNSLYPLPYVPLIEARISSKVDIQSTNNLSLATLEYYNSVEKNWVEIPSNNKTFAHSNQALDIFEYGSLTSFIIVYLPYYQHNNSLTFRLRYLGNGTFERFNVSIDELSIVFHIKDIFSSDITSKIGIGLDSNNLNPSDIKMKNFGVDIADSGVNQGRWQSVIVTEIPDQGLFKFNVTSIWDAITFDTTGTYTLYQIKPSLSFEGEIETEYMAGENSFSIKALDENSDEIENLNIVVQLIDTDNRIISEVSVNTNDEGIAYALLNFEDTGDNFYLKVINSEEGYFAQEEIKSDKFRIENELTIFVDNLIALSPYILIAFATVTGYLMIKKKKINALRKKWAQDAIFLNDILNLSYLLIIHKEVGVSVYGKNISEQKLDLDLISGFIHAISQFRVEFKKTQESEQKSGGLEMNYYDFKIILTDGLRSRVAFILEKDPSESLKKKQIKFTKEFEGKYGKFLESFNGDITVFSSTEELIERHFQLSLRFPYTLKKIQPTDKLSKLELSLVEISKQILLKNQQLLLSTLLGFAIAGREEMRDEIMSAVVDMVRKRILIPNKP